LTGAIATIRKNRSEELRVSIDDFKGHRLLNIGVWYEADGGEMRLIHGLVGMLAEGADG
jgi:hypothetical protein